MIKQQLEEKYSIALEHPANPSFGDYTSNIALRLAKERKQNPLQIAEEFKEKIAKDELVEKVEVVKPGFINIWLTKTVLIDELKEVIKNDDETTSKKTQKILLEFGQPNTHKLPHIGHLYSYMYGESLARILETQGNTIYRVNYQGDVGLHVAKCLYIVQQKESQISQLKTLKAKVEFLQVCYQEGSAAYEENAQAKEEINQLNKKIFERDTSIKQLWETTRSWSIEYYKDFENKLGTKYDRWYFETETGPIGKKLVEENIGKVFEKSEGAVVFKAEKYGLHTRVFINKLGLPTYEAKDVGLYYLKKKEFPFDKSIVTIANEQAEYQKVVMKASELVFPELTGKLMHIAFGMINLTTGKMSSRTGKIVDAVGLVEIVQDQIQKTFSLTDEKLIEKIALAAIKYSFLKSDAFSNIAFDLEKSISKDGDSGPYLLYTYVRCQSILEKEKVTTVELPDTLTAEELLLLRSLYRLPEVSEKAAHIYSPHLITNYLFELAKTFNLFYQKSPVLKADENTKKFRLALTEATAQVIKNGLYLLGIETVNKM